MARGKNDKGKSGDYKTWNDRPHDIAKGERHKDGIYTSIYATGVNNNTTAER